MTMERFQTEIVEPMVEKFRKEGRLPAEQDPYLATVDRLEQEIVSIDSATGWTSIAISLKRIADVLELTNAYGERGFEAVAGTLSRLNLK